MGEKPLSVEEWIERLKGLRNVGEMTHWERMEKAFNLEEPDMVPVAPEADYWPCYYQGYTSWEVFEGKDAVAKRTHALIKTWAEFRWDAIWQYVDLSEELDPLVPPEKRRDHYVIRGPKDYVVFKPAATRLDDAIKLFQDRVWEKYGYGHAAEYFIPHLQQLLEFQRGMNNSVPVITGAATPSNHAETTVEVQRFVKWMVTEPKQKMHDYMNLVLQERLEALDGYREFAAKNGCEFFCCWGGGRTWGPRHWDEFGEYDEIFVEKARRIFENVFWHVCGMNLKETIIRVATRIPVKAVQFDTPLKQYKMSWPGWFEWVAKQFKGRRCAMSSPTTQLLMHGTPDEVKAMVKTFIKHTTPYTTAVVMTPCEVGAYTPPENVRAMVEAARTYGKYRRT